jgi:thioredoxin reductase (NADPH)
MEAQTFDLIVVGEGVAGLHCARRAAERGLRTATFERAVFGGLILNVNELDPPPANAPHSGAELASAIVEANAELDVESHPDETVTGLRATASGFDVIAGDSTYHARYVVAASGARRRMLGVPGEEAFAGRGVSQCADCDGPMYGNADVVVIGGGDSALQEALVLARYCKTVHLVHRRGKYRAQGRFVDRLAGEPRIRPILDSEVRAVVGETGVAAVTLLDRSRDATRELPCTGVFAYVGLVPNSEWLPAEVRRDNEGGVVTDGSFATSVPGLWAIGAVRSGYGGTVAHALDEAERASLAIAALAT